MSVPSPEDSAGSRTGTASPKRNLVHLGVMTSVPTVMNGGAQRRGRPTNSGTPHGYRRNR